MHLINKICKYFIKAQTLTLVHRKVNLFRQLRSRLSRARAADTDEQPCQVQEFHNIF